MNHDVALVESKAGWVVVVDIDPHDVASPAYSLQEVLGFKVVDGLPRTLGESLVAAVIFELFPSSLANLDVR